MSLGLIKPGIRSANMTGKRHPKTGEYLVPLGYLKDGSPVWPVLGAASDDPDDPAFTGEGDTDEDDEDEDDDEEDDSKSKKRPVKKTKSKKDEDDDDEDDDEEDDKPSRPERQAARYRTRLREKERELAAMSERLRALEDKDKKPDEVATRDLEEARSKVDALTQRNRSLTLENAFFKANTVNWVDPADALRLVDLEDVDVDEDGTVDAVQLRKALRALAKLKPHLVKKEESKSSAQDDSDDDEDDEEPRSRSSASTMNRQRRGSKDKGPSRDQLAKKFPVLNRL